MNLQIPFDRRYRSGQKHLCGNVAPGWMPIGADCERKAKQMRDRKYRMNLGYVPPQVDTSNVKVSWHEQPMNVIKARATKVVKSVKSFFGRVLGRS